MKKIIVILCLCYLYRAATIVLREDNCHFLRVDKDDFNRILRVCITTVFKLVLYIISMSYQPQILYYLQRLSTITLTSTRQTFISSLLKSLNKIDWLAEGNPGPDLGQAQKMAELNQLMLCQPTSSLLCHWL